MANEIKVASAVREALTGNAVGRDIKADVASVVRETIKGESVGRDVMADVASVVREVLTGDGYGSNTPASVYSVVRETITGDSLGLTWRGGVVSVVREILTREPPARLMSASRESLMYLPGDPLTVSHIVPSYRQAVVMARLGMPLPGTVKSMEMVFTLRQMALQRTARTPVISYDYAATLRMLTLVDRTTAPTMRSPITAWVFRQQVVQSRTKSYVPVSAVYAATERQLVVQHRVTVPAPSVRTAIRVGAQVQQIALSRRVEVIVILTDAFVSTQVQQVLMQDTRPAPHSPIDAATLVEMVVQKHNVVPPGIDDRVGALAQQVMIERVPVAPRGPEHVGALVQQAVIERVVPATQWSAINVAGQVMLTVQHRESIPPQYALGWRVNNLREQILIERDPAPVMRSAIAVGSMRVTYTLRRIVPPPIDVIDPAVGRHVAQLRMISVQHRVTQPPEVISKLTRFVYSLAGQVVVGDVFPLPEYPPVEPPITVAYSVLQEVLLGDNSGWAPVSALTARALAEAVVVGDDIWSDPTVPVSEVAAFGVHQALVVIDAFPDPATLLGDAVAMGLVEALAVGDDDWIDPTLPQSAITVAHLAAQTVLGDAALPDPTIPLSDVSVSLLAAFAAVHDDSLSGRFEMSAIATTVVIEQVVLPDKGLVGVPLRYGARPKVTVSMS